MNLNDQQIKSIAEQGPSEMSRQLAQLLIAKARELESVQKDYDALSKTLVGDGLARARLEREVKDLLIECRDRASERDVALLQNEAYRKALEEIKREHDIRQDDLAAVCRMSVIAENALAEKSLKRVDATEPRYCNKCGVEVKKEDAAHPYVCDGKRPCSGGECKLEEGHDGDHIVNLRRRPFPLI